MQRGDSDSEVDDALWGGIRVWAQTKLGWKKRRRAMPAVLDVAAEEAAVG